MKLAIISDIHGNFEALTAVLEDLQRQSVDAVYCLGDIVGYGPDPAECIDVVMTLEAAILGNHDQGALFNPEGFSSGAERAIFWTRDRLESEPNDEARERRWDFLRNLPRQRHVNEFTFVHGSARNPLTEYVFPEDVHNSGKMERIFSLIRHYWFQGHTHVPGIFVESGFFYPPSEIQYEYELGAERAMINVGSVGQPRDGNPEASYVILHEHRVNFRRVPYPLEHTIAKIYEVSELDRFLGDRLREGR